MKSFKIFPLIIILTVFSGAFSVYHFISAQSHTCVTYRIASWNGCEPLISTAGTISTDKYSAVVNAYYSSNGADYNTLDWPALYIEYGRSDTNDFSETSDLRGQGKGTKTEGFILEGLEEGVWYQYRAALNWVGGVKYGDVKRFQAVKKIMPEEPTVTTTTSNTQTTNSTPVETKTTTTNNNTTTNNTTNTTTNSTTTTQKSTNTGTWSIFGTTRKNIAPVNEPLFKNVDERSGFKLAIDDERTEVRQGDTVTIKVRYENNNTKSFSNGSVEVYLPDQMLVTGTNKGVIDKVGNRVVISLRDFPAGAFGTATVTAQVTQPAGDLDQVMTQAGLKISDVVLKVADVNEYIGGSKNSTLGASTGNVGFLPGSIIGWVLLLVILAGMVILGRRYFMQKDY